MGLHIMHYRASVIEARLDIRRGPHGGTIVTCIIEKADGEKGFHEKSEQTNKRYRKKTRTHRR
jgi:hypothetical protein